MFHMALLECFYYRWGCTVWSGYQHRWNCRFIFKLCLGAFSCEGACLSSTIWLWILIIDELLCCPFHFCLLTCMWFKSSTQINAINAATEAACLILSVDETVKNPKVKKWNIILSSLDNGGLLLWIISCHTYFS